MSITILHECKCKPVVADLLAALKEIMRSVALNQCAMNQGLVDAARAAIARAEGGTK